jgi:hypothetical protein
MGDLERYYGDTMAGVDEETDMLALAKELAWIGLIGTAVSIPIGLWAVPRFKGERAWIAAALLTAVGYGVKVKLMKH